MEQGAQYVLLVLLLQVIWNLERLCGFGLDGRGGCVGYMEKLGSCRLAVFHRQN